MQRLIFPLDNPDRGAAALLVPHRTLDQILRNENAPVVPGADPFGWHLVDVDEGVRLGCRFPIGRDRGGHRFCAEEVEDPQRGTSLGSYCDFHRNYLRRQPSVADEEAA